MLAILWPKDIVPLHVETYSQMGAGSPGLNRFQGHLALVEETAYFVLPPPRRAAAIKFLGAKNE
jgi:hypothetical protein